MRDRFEIAEDAFFECPQNNERVGSFSEAYQLMQRFQGEVEVVLDMQRVD